MKHLTTLAIATAITFCGLTACGNSPNSSNGSDSTTTKIDTTANPADATNAVKSDSTKPDGAVGLDTVAGGKSTSSGMKDTSKHK